MRRLMPATFAALAIACLSIDADAAPTAITSDALAHLNSIGIVNATGNQIKLTILGTTAFTNKGSNLSIDDWKIGDDLVRQVSELVGPGIKVGMADVDVAAFEKASGAFLNPVESQLTKIVKAKPDPNWDTYLLLKTVAGYDQYFGPMEGLGYRHRDFFGSGSDLSYAYLEFYLIDAKTGTMVAEAPARTSWPSVDVHWEGQGDTASLTAALKSDFATYFSHGLVDKLKDMGLSRPEKPGVAQ